jgi:hypothetical protein
MADNGSDSSDEWGMEELVIPPQGAIHTTDEAANEKGDDEYWAVEKPAEPAPPPKEENTKNTNPGEPMIIVDITQIDAKIHSKFDRNSVNDSAGASAMRKKIETVYEQYARDASLLADGTVVPCGSSVWRDALVCLRDERPGHYFAPIFPPKKK